MQSFIIWMGKNCCGRVVDSKMKEQKGCSKTIDIVSYALDDDSEFKFPYRLLPKI